MIVYATISCFIVIITLNTDFVIANSWTYSDEEHWPELCNSGKSQSPIALSESYAQLKEFPPFIFENYDHIYPAKVKNNGHSAEIRLLVPEQPKINGGGLPEEFTLDHIHFHWQSEHTINDYRYPLEMHLVHYASRYGSVASALGHDKGIAVISILFDLSPDDDGKFAPLIEVIGKVHDHVGQPEEKSFDMKYYLPRDVAGFYRYNGSLTTPNCNEGLIWTVFTNTLPISQKQVQHFKTMQDEDNHELPKNYRSLQPLNGRTVHLKMSPIRNLAHRVSTSHSSLILILFSTFTKYMLI